MPDTVQAAAIVALLVVPGFFAFYISRELSPNTRHDITEAELLFSSIGFASILLAIEIIIIAATANQWPNLPLFGGLTERELRNSGFSAVLRENPSRVLTIISCQFLFHCIVISIVGWVDPLSKAIVRIHKRRGFNPADPWTLGLEGLRREFKEEATWVRVTMNSGTIFYGFLSHFSNRPRTDGTRDIVLQAFTRSSDFHTMPTPFHSSSPEKSVLAINTKDIASIEGAFTKPYS